MSTKRKRITYHVDDNGCWVCTSHYINLHGYPTVWKNGSNHNMHRVLYEEKYGKLDTGLVVRHKCDNRSCINLDHLESGTWQQNTLDCKNRARLNTPKGELRSDSKLSKNQVINIRDNHSISQYELAKIYGVSQSTISRIKNNKRRKYD